MAIKINLNKFLEKQIALDLEIHKTRNISVESTVKKRQMGLIVELYEFINETKVFKYWSNSKPDRQKLLFEYVDMLHFTLSLALTYQIDINEVYFVEEEQHDADELLEFFISLSKNIVELTHKENFHEWIKKFMKIGTLCGLKFSEIEKAYFEKLSINQQRQLNNY